MRQKVAGRVQAPQRPATAFRGSSAPDSSKGLSQPWCFSYCVACHVAGRHAAQMAMHGAQSRKRQFLGVWPFLVGLAGFRQSLRRSPRRS